MGISLAINISLSLPVTATARRVELISLVVLLLSISVPTCGTESGLLGVVQSFCIVEHASAAASIATGAVGRVVLNGQHALSDATVSLAAGCVKFLPKVKDIFHARWWRGVVHYA